MTTCSLSYEDPLINLKVMVTVQNRLQDENMFVHIHILGLTLK